MKNFFKIVFSLFLLFSISSFAAALESKDNDVGKVKVEIVKFDQSQEVVKSIDLTNSDQLVSFSIMSNSYGTDKEFITQTINKDFTNYFYVDKLKISRSFYKKIERYYCRN